MTTLAISSIVIGFALVYAGIRFGLRVPQADPAGHHGPNEFRQIIDALEEQDRRYPHEQRD